MLPMTETAKMPARTRTWLMILILIGILWRVGGLFTHTFRPDEALFASYARLIAVWRDPLLQTQLVDKPPLAFYAQAAFFPLLGADGFAARLPNLIASILLLPLLAQWLWHLYRAEMVVIVGVIVFTFSPLAIQSSATAFLDPLMLALLVGSLWAGAAGGRGRPVAAGMLFGLALLTKYQALLYAPLIVGQGRLFGWAWRKWRRWLVGLLPPLALFLLWQWAHGAPFVWQAQAANYGGLRLIWSWELWPRLNEWGRVWSAVLGTPPFFLALLLPVFIAWLVQQEDWETALDQLFTAALLAYFLLLWFVAGPVEDRYLLLALPLVALVVARLTARAWSLLPLLFPRIGVGRWMPALWIGLCVAQMPASVRAYHSQFPVGSWPDADDGAAQVGAFLADAPYGTVLYDHWYNWQWRYYFFDTGVYVNWFPHPAALLDDLRVFAHTPGSRYLVLPAADAAAPVRRALRDAGYRLETAFAATRADGQPGMILYRIDPP